MCSALAAGLHLALERDAALQPSQWLNCDVVDDFIQVMLMIVVAVVGLVVLLMMMMTMVVVVVAAVVVVRMMIWVLVEMRSVLSHVACHTVQGEIRQPCSVQQRVLLSQAP